MNFISMFAFLASFSCTSDKETEEFQYDGCVGTAYEGNPLCSVWLFNTNNEKSVVLQEDSAGILVDIAYTEIQDGHLVVYASGIPNYSVTVTDADIQMLNSRPNAATDFVDGETILQAGVTYDFGADIGYRSNSECAVGAGYGWWPPGPTCPTNQNKAVSFPLEPQPASTTNACETGLGALGLFVNGVSVYNWSDGASYNNQGVWMNVAAKYEAYDLGLCRGHAARGDYHHHDLSNCLMDAVGDEGTGHSPVYGVAADGYLIYGPYVGSNKMAESCWVVRDYNNANDPYGCGGTGERSCVMVDVYMPSLGVTDASQSGPNTNAIVTSMSGNNFIATTGFYKEDYYYDADCTAMGIEYLDQYNGHDHDDYGYHYHITYTYPYFTGPTLYGTVDSTSDTMCDGVQSGPPPR